MDYQATFESPTNAELNPPAIISTNDSRGSLSVYGTIFIHDGTHNSLAYPFDAVGTGGQISQKSLTEIVQRTFSTEEQITILSTVSNSDKINAIRKGFGVPVTLLAKSLGVSRQAIYDWIKGEEISIDNVNKIQCLYDSLQEITKSNPVQLSYHIKRKIFNGMDFFEAFRNGQDPIKLAKQMETVLFVEEKQSKKLNEKLASNYIEDVLERPGIPSGGI